MPTPRMPRTPLDAAPQGCGRGGRRSRRQYPGHPGRPPSTAVRRQARANWPHRSNRKHWPNRSASPTSNADPTGSTGPENTPARPAAPGDTGALPADSARWSPPAQPDAANQPPNIEQTRVSPRGRRLQDPSSTLRMEHSSPPPPSPVPPPPIASDSGQLPRRVEQVDPNATQVTPAAYQQRASDRSTLNRPRPGGPPPGGQPPRNQLPIQRREDIRPRRRLTRAVWACLPRGVPARARRLHAVCPPAGARPPGGAGWAARCAGLVALLFMVVFVVVGAGSWLVFQYFAIAQELPPVDQLRDPGGPV